MSTSATVLDGKQVANTIKRQLCEQIVERVSKGFLPPGLAVILVGSDPASKIYVDRKQKTCEELGFHSISHVLDDNITEQQLLELITKLNHDSAIHGILVQLPLPPHLCADSIINAVEPSKDVDGFHPYNVGRLALRAPLLRSCTPKGVMRLLTTYGYDLTSKEVVVVGASNIVGRPMALEALHADATVTICHSKTENLRQHIEKADVLVVAIGQPNFIKGSWIKPSAVIIDVGINRLENGKIVGDVDFETAVQQAGAITPVPGGVGPMTVAMLMENTFEAAVALQSSQQAAP